MSSGGNLPVFAVLDEVRRALTSGTSAVLVAPPGAGKTTAVPLALIDEPWLQGRKIVILEPRRVAARAAAERMASLLGEPVGATIGLRARLDTRVGKSTRIEVVTEGVFSRLILDDPALQDIGLVVFDEFHERSLDADFGLALALDARAGLRPDLRLLVMSATLDGARVAALLGNSVPVIRSEGRAFAIETRYVGRPDGRTNIADAVVAVARRALLEESGSVLAFLPGQAEIRRAAGRLRELDLAPSVDVVELHGGLTGDAQRAAIQPPENGRRRVVLATAVAQTSITIEGVRVVVDCGLERVARHDANAGLTRLETVRVSRATADQRRGRAGRTEPGVCYRLWSEPETQGLVAFTAPEILGADLSSLMLDCAAWGVTDPATLTWLDPPPPGALAVARTELTLIGALDSDGRLTDLGHQLRALPLAPRLSRMIIDAAMIGAAGDAALVAAILSERGAGGRSADLDERLQALRRDRGGRSEALKRMAREWKQAAERSVGRSTDPETGAISIAALLALAYPDRIAKARGPRGTFLLANGRAGFIDGESPMADAPFLVVADMTGTAASSRILLAARLDERDLEKIAGHRIEESLQTAFDASAAALRSRAERRLGAIVLASEPRPVVPDEHAAAALVDGIVASGIARLPWSKAQRQLRHRVAFVRAALAEHDGGPWPDLSDAVLSSTASEWLAPFVVGLTRLADISADRLGLALDGLLPWPLRQRLDAEAPIHFVAPTGNHLVIDYESDGAPVVSCRVQELFGLKSHPSIASGRLPLTLHLLSPAGRPVQITRDLPGFWAGSWRDVKADMKGRYPKHPWPDDPANATPTTRIKPRGT